ncbi:MAG TPA: hypothetical protein VLL05_01845 [Terriglobales bacterium]|nr:hypothetical protein [Terriglobales bacterium]
MSQHLLTPGSEEQQHLTPVFPAPHPPDIPRSYEPVYEFHGAMVLDLQTLSQFADGGTHLAGQPFQTEHQLVLSWLQARGTGRLLTEREKAAYLVTQFRQ